MQQDDYTLSCPTRPINLVTRQKVRRIVACGSQVVRALCARLYKVSLTSAMQSCTTYKQSTNSRGWWDTTEDNLMAE